MADNQSNLALRCELLHRHLGEGDGRVHVLRGVTFEAKRGHICAIVGPSGCGKSTLLYLLGLLDQPDSGSIWIRDRLMSNSSDLERTITIPKPDFFFVLAERRVYLKRFARGWPVNRWDQAGPMWAELSSALTWSDREAQPASAQAAWRS